MSEYIPDRWVVVKIGDTNLYKVFGCWYGGYAGSDSWKLNSGITSVSKEGGVYSFKGFSGSTYQCHEDSYGTNFYGGSVLSSMITDATTAGIDMQILDYTVDFMNLTYE